MEVTIPRREHSYHHTSHSQGHIRTQLALSTQAAWSSGYEEGWPSSEEVQLHLLRAALRSTGNWLGVRAWSIAAPTPQSSLSQVQTGVLEGLLVVLVP